MAGEKQPVIRRYARSSRISRGPLSCHRLVRFENEIDFALNLPSDRSRPFPRGPSELRKDLYIDVTINTDLIQLFHCSKEGLSFTMD